MIILADTQDITRAGMQFIIEKLQPNAETIYAEDKASTIEFLKSNHDATVIVDYTQFDFINDSEMLIVAQRFPDSHWVLFSEDLSSDFVKRIIGSSLQFSVLLKESSLHEIKECLKYAIKKHRYICQRTTELLFAVPTEKEQEVIPLTKTELEILKEIALGFTTKEIAERRFSSFHTVNTHRKNIFRKLSVNNVHEATRYALRAGIIDEAEYYI